MSWFCFYQKIFHCVQHIGLGYAALHKYYYYYHYYNQSFMIHFKCAKSPTTLSLCMNVTCNLCMKHSVLIVFLRFSYHLRVSLLVTEVPRLDFQSNIWRIVSFAVSASVRNEENLVVLLWCSDIAKWRDSAPDIVGEMTPTVSSLHLMNK